MSPPASPRALFVVVEGIECSGKSTLLAALAERLRSEGRDVLVTREPGGTPLGEAVRAIALDRSIAVTPMAEALLMNAARTQHVAAAIRPALETGCTVLCDRYVDSTLAYQGYGRGLDLGVLRALCDAATGGLMPDVTLIVDVPVSVSRERMRLRGVAADRMESEDDGFHERVRQGYLELSKRTGGYLLDGARNAPDVLRQALDALATVLG